MDIRNDSEVQSLFLTAKFFYYAMHLLVILILAIYDNPLRLQVLQHYFTQSICLSICLAFQFYLYEICREVIRN